MTVEIERRAVEIQGHRVTYGVAGTGSSVVLVHGLSGSARWWRPLLPFLAVGHRVYAVNLPGHGHASGRRQRATLADMTEWLREWIEAVDLGRTHVIGYSMGGYLALRLCLAAPELVDHLVLVASTGVPTVRSLLGYAWPLLREARVLKPALLPVLTADALRAGPVTLLRSASELLGQDIRPELASVRAPTLLVWGERDVLVPVSVGHLLQEEIPGSRLVVIPQAGHVPMFDDPKTVADVILRFLEQKVTES